MLEKPKRVVNKKLIKDFQGRPCVVCGKPGNAHHIKSKGSSGNDTKNNLICLCFTHHREVHDTGKLTFYNKYKWYIPEINRKAFNE